jgi:hypothetical protein
VTHTRQTHAAITSACKILIGLVVFTASFVGHARAQLYGIDWNTANLYRISPTDASMTLVGTTVPGQHFADIQFALDGTLYGFTAGFPTELYKIDPSTAQATLLTQLHAPVGNQLFIEGGLTFAPDGTAIGAHYLTTPSTDNLFTFDPNNLNGGLVNIGVAVNDDINGLAYRNDGKLVALADFSNSLEVIDPVTGMITPLAPVPTMVGAVGGMTVLNGVGYYSTGGPMGTPSAPAGSNQLYSFDLYTGASTLIGSFSPTINDLGISGLAAVIPEPATGRLAAAGISFLLVPALAHRRAGRRGV